MCFRTWFVILAYYNIFGNQNLSRRYSMSCCSDDLAQRLLYLDLWSLQSENIFVLYICNSIKLPSFQRFEAVVVIVIDLIHNIIVFDAQANTTCHFALQCANRGVYFVVLQYNTCTYLLCTDNWYCILHLQSAINSEAICGQGGPNLMSSWHETTVLLKWSLGGCWYSTIVLSKWPVKDLAPRLNSASYTS